MAMLLVAAMLGSLVLDDSKLDVGLARAKEAKPIFVRLEGQLFPSGGAYEKFCQAHEKDPRSKLRLEVRKQLHENADKSWSKIRGFLANLEKTGKLHSVKRFWIVNGFACDAEPEALRLLAERDDVSFVYLQTGPPAIRQHLPRRSRPDDDRVQAEAMKTALERYRDDSGQPFKSEGLEVAWDLKQIQADQVWSKFGATGKGVIVALNDAGIFDIPSLRTSLWRNAKEKIDGKDDDGNGYVDDVFGWDAAKMSGLVLGDAGVSHGTMCGGIIAGRPTSEKKQVTGVAPRSRLMLINGMGYLEGMQYALDNGADIFSMSYMFVNMEIGNYRGVYRLAAEHMSAAGVLLLGGAGNFAKSAPEGQQITIPKDIPCVLAVAGTAEDGSRPEFSSKGPVTWSGVKFYDDYPASKPLIKPDVSAPAAGFACWNLAVDLRPQWKVVFEGKERDALVMGPQGNSFAGPHAAGVAALMLSVYPDLNPWQTKQILEETSKDMGEPGRDKLHGAGLIQALEAVRKAKAMASAG